MNKLDKLLVVDIELDIKFGNKVRCLHHENQGRKTYCTPTLDKDVFTKELIYGRSKIYRVKNYQWCCPKIKSRKYSILKHSDKIIFDDEESESNYVTVDGDCIYKCKTIYLTYDLMIYFNEITINSDSKYIGIFISFLYYFYIIFILFLYYFYMIFILFLYDFYMIFICFLFNFY